MGIAVDPQYRDPPIHLPDEVSVLDPDATVRHGVRAKV